MSDEDFDTTNASSVHLQDLSKLVSAFNEKRNTAFQVKNDGQDSGFHASDGVTTVTTTLKVDSNSKDRGLTMSTFRRDRAAKLNWIQHVPSKESSKVIFKEGFNGISTECREVRSLADSVPSTGTDSAATEGTRNSLYLINELCDRLVTNDPQNNKQYADNPTATETTFLALETPFNRTSQLSYPGARETVLSAPNATSNHYGFYPNSQQLSAEQISPLKNTTYFEPEQSNNSVTAPKERHGIECAINVNENTEEDSLDQRDQPLNTSEPIGAISHMQQMLERLTPPVELRGVAEKQGSGSTNELSRGNVFQCTSLSSFEGRNTGASSSATPSTHSTSSGAGSSQNSPGKYSELLAVIEELGKDIRPTYAGSKNAAERLKKGIMHARVLVRECLVETEKCARQ